MPGHTGWATIQYRKKIQHAKHAEGFILGTHAIIDAAKAEAPDLTSNNVFKAAADKAGGKPAHLKARDESNEDVDHEASDAARELSLNAGFVAEARQ